MRSRTHRFNGNRWPALALCALAAAACDSNSGASRDADSEASREAGAAEPELFSFFVTSLKAMQALSGSEVGFGGDLRYGETGPGAGLRGADKICAEIAERSLPGASKKGWRAFLSAVASEDGTQVNAIDRIGEGPWYDRLGRLLAESKADLLSDRPLGIDTTIAHDLPNEDGIPNQKPDPDRPSVDNHDVLTGTNSKGELYSATATCLDWTSALGDTASEGRPRVGHSWDRMAADLEIVRPSDRPPDALVGDGGPWMIGADLDLEGGVLGDGGERRMGMLGLGPMMMAGPGMGGSGQNWMSVLDEAGCAAGINLIQDGPPKVSIPTVGSGGGYGAIYCFALAP